MNAQRDAGGLRAACEAKEIGQERVSAPALDDSWFKWPKPITTKPPPPPPVLDDGLADAWFR